MRISIKFEGGEISMETERSVADLVKYLSSCGDEREPRKRREPDRKKALFRLVGEAIVKDWARGTTCDIEEVRSSGIQSPSGVANIRKSDGACVGVSLSRLLDYIREARAAKGATRDEVLSVLSNLGGQKKRSSKARWWEFDIDAINFINKCR